MEIYLFLNSTHCNEVIKVGFKVSEHLYLSPKVNIPLDTIIDDIKNTIIDSYPEKIDIFFLNLNELIKKIVEKKDLKEDTKLRQVGFLSIVCHGMDSLIVRNQGWPVLLSPFLLPRIDDFYFMPPFLVKNGDPYKKNRQKVTEDWLEQAANLTLRTIRHGYVFKYFTPVIMLFERTSNDYFKITYKEKWTIRGFVLSWYFEILELMKERCSSNFLDFYYKGNQNLCTMLCEIKDDKTAPKEIRKKAKKFSALLSGFLKVSGISKRDKWCDGLFPSPDSLKK